MNLKRNLERNSKRNSKRTRNGDGWDASGNVLFSSSSNFLKFFTKIDCSKHFFQLSRNSAQRIMGDNSAEQPALFESSAADDGSTPQPANQSQLACCGECMAPVHCEKKCSLQRNHAHECLCATHNGNELAEFMCCVCHELCCLDDDWNHIECTECGGPRHYFGCSAGVFREPEPLCERPGRILPNGVADLATD